MNPKQTPTREKPRDTVTTISIPYIKGTSERIRRCLSQVNIWVAFKSRTVRSLLMKVKPQRFLTEHKGVDIPDSMP